MRPFIIALAGVNGAGKSSVGGALLEECGLTWFNPDSYARQVLAQLEFSLEEANGVAWNRGKSLLEEAIANRTNHAFETTLGGHTITRMLQEAAKTHDVHVIYCGLASPELHIERVTMRVAHGGHPIPDDTIRRRWDSSRLNLVTLLPFVTTLQVFDNSRSVQAGEHIPDPLVVLELDRGRILVPDVSDPQALAAVPQWAEPIVEAAIQTAHRGRRNRK